MHWSVQLQTGVENDRRSFFQRSRERVDRLEEAGRSTGAAVAGGGAGVASTGSRVEGCGVLGNVKVLELVDVVLDARDNGCLIPVHVAKAAVEVESKSREILEPANARTQKPCR